MGRGAGRGAGRDIVEGGRALVGGREGGMAGRVEGAGAGSVVGRSGRSGLPGLSGGTTITGGPPPYHGPG
jgi:hypothetical protein